MSIVPLLPSGRYGNMSELVGAIIIGYTDGDIIQLSGDDTGIFPAKVIDENTYLYSDDTVLSNVIDTILKGDRLRYNHIVDLYNVMKGSEILEYFYSGLMLFFINKYLEDRGN